MSNESPTDSAVNTPATGVPVIAPSVEPPKVEATPVVESPKIESSTSPKVEAATAPEAYADFKMPEGVKVDPDLMKEFAAFAKEKNLSQEDAQKFADLGAKAAQKTQEAHLKQIEAAQAQWTEASKIDKEFGGDKLDANVAVAQKALEAFGSPELKQMLVESGLGNHPEVIRAFYKVGLAISEDKLISGGAKSTSQNPLTKMYPSMTK